MSYDGNHGKSEYRNILPFIIVFGNWRYLDGRKCYLVRVNLSVMPAS